MKDPKLKVVRFAAQDVIATSAPPPLQIYLTGFNDEISKNEKIYKGDSAIEANLIYSSENYVSGQEKSVQGLIDSALNVTATTGIPSDAVWSFYDHVLNQGNSIGRVIKDNAGGFNYWAPPITDGVYTWCSRWYQFEHIAPE